VEGENRPDAPATRSAAHGGAAAAEGMGQQLSDASFRSTEPIGATIPTPFESPATPSPSKRAEVREIEAPAVEAGGAGHWASALERPAHAALEIKPEGPTSSPTPPGASAEFQRALEAQVERGISQAARQAMSSGQDGPIGGGSVTMRLHPANLGMLRVTLRLEAGSGEGVGVFAKFESSSARTRGLLDDSIAALRSALQDRGLKVGEVVVVDMPRLPERDVGLPPLPHERDQAANLAHDAGPGFAGDQSNHAPEHGAFMGGAHEGRSAESGGATADEIEIGENAERPVTLGASPLTMGLDGRIRLDAIV
jgi:hypothetical protein